MYTFKRINVTACKLFLNKQRIYNLPQKTLIASFPFHHKGESAQPQRIQGWELRNCKEAQASRPRGQAQGRGEGDLGLQGGLGNCGDVGRPYG